ncbi:hypothetical protein [Algoriphagus pacificus]|uniref:Uncharacterized protein n=1 Tax=Algoriphagus pacificus TaxID=2811234 RepID=A0ABS3CKM9_9BACT|nr:hypothetical protein [Algoriphagus pacificus]MBN7817653.1 hypothetical protein [Algoriphagus pacificus]
MKKLFASLIERVKNKETSLTFYEQLVDKTWLKIDESRNILRQLEFQRNGELLDSNHGNVTRKKWELTASGKIIISFEGKEQLFYATFSEIFKLTLIKSGSIDSSETFLEEKYVINSVKEFLQQENERLIQEEQKKIEEARKREEAIDLQLFKSGIPNPKQYREVMNTMANLSKDIDKRFDSRINDFSKNPPKIENLIKFYDFLSTHEQNNDKPFFSSRTTLESQKDDCIKVIREIDSKIDHINNSNPNSQSESIELRRKKRNLIQSKEIYQAYYNYLLEKS